MVAVDVYGEALIQVLRGGKSYKLACKLVDNGNLRPILDRRACVGMGILQYTDNDSIGKPDTHGAQVFVTDPRFSLLRPISKEELRERFPAVFAEKTGKLIGWPTPHPGQ